jgi:hypothetical protein
MHQLILLIPTSINLDQFDQGWPRFLKAAEKMPGLIKESLTQINHHLYGDQSFHRIYCFSFPDQETLEKSLVSEPGEIAGKIIHDLTDGKIILLIGEYREDTIDNIKSYNKR